MAWLISYRSRYAQLQEWGVRMNDARDDFTVSRDHPAQWFAEQEAALRKLCGSDYNPGLGPQTAYEIVRIYGAIEVPHELRDALLGWQDAR